MVVLISRLFIGICALLRMIRNIPHACAKSNKTYYCLCVYHFGRGRLSRGKVPASAQKRGRKKATDHAVAFV